MNRVLRYAIGLAVFVLMAVLATGSTLAQQAGQQPPPPQQPPQQPGQTATPPATPPVNQEEEDAYKAFYEAKGSDPVAIIAAGEGFLKKFPESRYRESVYSRLAQAYLNSDDPQKLEKLAVAAEKALQLNPDNVDVLSVYSYSMLRRFDPNALDAEQKLNKAETTAKHGIELLNSMQKPAAITDEDFARAKNEKLAMCRSGLGLAYLHRQRYTDATTELEQATTLISNPDPTDLWLLALVYQGSKRYQEAAGAFGRCSEIEWPWKDRCKTNAANAKKMADQAGAPKP